MCCHTQSTDELRAPVSGIPAPVIQKLREAKRYLIMEIKPSRQGNARNLRLFAEVAKEYNVDLQTLFDTVKL